MAGVMFSLKKFFHMYFVVFILLICDSYAQQKEACNAKNCKPPNCRCPSPRPPGGLLAKQVPQVVLVAFDDAVNSNIRYYEELFPGTLVNPNYCPIVATFFVSDVPSKENEPTDYSNVKKLYDRGHELASHSISHRMPLMFWDTANYSDYVTEIYGEKMNIVVKSGVPPKEIKGMRVPFLQNGGDNMFKMLKDYNFTYDSSLVTGPIKMTQFHSKEPIYPYTLDIPPSPKLCDVYPGTCPKASYPGLWEIPLNRMFGNDGMACSMADACSHNLQDVAATFNYLVNNFNLYYNRNRAPFGVYIHSSWFIDKPWHFEGLKKFIEHVAGMKDTWIISMSQAIEWMKNPTPLQRIRWFKPWKNSKLPCNRRGKGATMFHGNGRKVVTSYNNARVLGCGNYVVYLILTIAVALFA